MHSMRALGILLVLVSLTTGGWLGYRHWMAPPETPQYRTEEIKRGGGRTDNHCHGNSRAGRQSAGRFASQRHDHALVR